MVTRRDFLKTMSMASAGLALGTGDLLHAQTASPKKGRGDKVKIAYIGIGNRGEQIIEDFARTGMVEVVALCDVDMGAKHTQKIMAKYPKAKQFRDFRQMFDKAGNEFDAVAIATPDHSHFPISMLALASGKHVYVEKPLARTFYEAELLMQAALKRPNLVTQVGNQGHSEANYFQFKAWMDAGIIKDVTAITAHITRAVGISGTLISISFLRDSNCRKIWTGTLGSELLLITSIIKIIIWDNGVVGMILVWVHWATGEHISLIRLTNFWNWDCLMRSLCNTQKGIMIISSHILPRFSSVSRNVKECHR